MAANFYYPSNLSYHLYTQVLSGSDLCDTIIEVKDKEITCHAAVLSCVSDITKELLDLAPINGNGKKVLNFTSACSESMYCVLNYIYTGTESFNTSNVTRVLGTALLVGVRSLQGMCLNYIEVTRKGLLMQSTSKIGLIPPTTSKREPSGGNSDGEFDRWEDDRSSRHSGDLDQDSKTHLSLHRVIRIVKPHSACSSPRSDIEEIENIQNSSPQSVCDPLNEMKKELKNDRTPSFPAHARAHCGPIDAKKYCKDCNRGFATVGSYTRHLRMIHYKLRPLNCDVCGHAFYQRSDLKKHMQRQHQKENQNSSTSLTQNT